MSSEVCGDNRFEIIEKAKKDLLESTNISTSEDEMQVIDNFLFRCWQMGWLEKYEQPKEKWILCEIEMPKERDSMFAKAKGTDKWNDAMFEKISSDVNVTVELKDGTRITETSHTIDGKWKIEQEMIVKRKVIAWQPLPAPYKKEGAENEKQRRKTDIST